MYGFPYKGSKKKLADRILEIVPPAGNFYDLFAGGCAVTHAALLREDIFGKQYKNIYSNDIQGTTQLFLDGVNGKYKDEKRWIGREEFQEKKDSDQYIKWIWSFGNNGRDYMFGKSIEALKKEAHHYLLKNGYDGSAQSRINLLKQFKSEAMITTRLDLQQLGQLQQLEQLQQLQRLQQLQQLERLERLQRLEQLQQLLQLERLQRLQTSSLDYRDVPIAENSVIYCDPPYKNTNHYGVDFDHEVFWDWVRNCPHPVYVSEYNAPNDIVCVASFKHRAKLSAKSNNGVVENLYWNGRSL